MKKILVVLVLLAVVLLIGCDNDAYIASKNLEHEADQFRILRRTVFINGITDNYLLSIEGYHSIKVDTIDDQLEVTCKTGPGQFKKHFLGLSDNVTYIAEQLESTGVSDTHYKVLFKPASIIPTIEIK